MILPDKILLQLIESYYKIFKKINNNLIDQKNWIMIPNYIFDFYFNENH